MCNEDLPLDGDCVKCNGCKKQFYYICIGVRESNYRMLAPAAKAAWRCRLCKTALPHAAAVTKGRTCSASDVDADNPGPLTIQDLRLVMREETAVINDKIDGLQQCIDFFTAQLDDLKKIIEDKDVKLDSVLGRFDVLHIENVKLSEENELLKGRVSHLEQYSRLNCIEIQGVPEPKDESVVHTVTKVASALNYKLNPEMIDACHRLGGDRSKQDRHRGIIVRFVRRWQKEDFMKARAIKRTISTKDLDPNVVAPTPIYINESLSLGNRKLYAQCLTYKRDNNIKYLWVKRGQIKMRKAENHRVFNINCVEDLNDVH